LSAEIEKELKRLKWNLWHGNVHKGLQIVEDLEYAVDPPRCPSFTASANPRFE
jgi:hypothetical protein